MIIWGWRSVTSTSSRGTFFCPDCAATKAYAEKSVRRFFRLYWIPLIPLNELGSYIECENCEKCYRPEVLEHDPERKQRQTLAELSAAAKHALELMMAAGGAIQDRRIAIVLQVYQGLTGVTRSPSGKFGRKPFG